MVQTSTSEMTKATALQPWLQPDRLLHLDALRNVRKTLTRYTIGDYPGRLTRNKEAVMTSPLRRVR